MTQSWQPVKVLSLEIVYHQNQLGMNQSSLQQIEVPQTIDGNSKVVVENKILLNRLKGVMRPRQFTAIMGPSGSGKTTLLNFLSGRLISDNLTLSGELFLNSKKINDMDKYNDKIAYVMQDDILLATFTARVLIRIQKHLEHTYKRILNRLRQDYSQKFRNQMAEYLDTKTAVKENDPMIPISEGFKLGDCVPIELAWNELIISAAIDVPRTVNGKQKVVVEHKILLDRLKGVMRPGQFTAIMGPSGSGKTTLLNFLSGRLISDNLTLSGELFLNSKKINDMDKYNDQIAYVMQDDILLATFTAREAFMFSANLRLQLPMNEKVRRVEQLILELGLGKCSNTRIGNNMIRGVSGGERKRASIGVELLTNPSLVFLDEPTTGLDSSTALQVIELLKRLAISGRTIVSTIHQPSSEIYTSFDRLMLLVRGNIIYQGGAAQAVESFAKIGFECPPLSNPSDYFMKLMNEEGLLVEKIQKGEADNLTDDQIEVEFNQRVNLYMKSYAESEDFKNLDPVEKFLIVENSNAGKSSWMQEFTLIFARSFLNEIRNPLDVKLKTVQSIVNAIMIMIVFSDLGNYFAGIQNRNGALFFITTTSAFGATQGALATFSMERALFLRERINKSYSTSAYFWARSLAEFPFQVILPMITTSIAYYAIGLSAGVDKFFILNFIQVLVYWYGVSYGLFLSILIPKVEVATALVPVLIIPFMVLAGFFVNQADVYYVFYPILYLSAFKYGFAASVINEFNGVTVYCAPNQVCDPVSMLSIEIGLWYNMLILFGLGFIFRVFAFLALNKISTPNKPKLRTIALAK